MDLANSVRELEVKDEHHRVRIRQLEEQRNAAKLEAKQAREEAEVANKQAEGAREDVEQTLLHLEEAKKGFEEELAQARAQAVEDFKKSEEFGSMLGDYGSGSYAYGLRLARSYLRTQLPEDQKHVVEGLKTVADLANDLELSASEVEDEEGDGGAGDDGGDDEGDDGGDVVGNLEDRSNSPIDID